MYIYIYINLYTVQCMMISILQLRACKRAEQSPQEEPTCDESSEAELTQNEDSSNNSCYSGTSPELAWLLGC